MHNSMPFHTVIDTQIEIIAMDSQIDKYLRFDMPFENKPYTAGIQMEFLCVQPEIGRFQDQVG